LLTFFKLFIINQQTLPSKILSLPQISFNKAVQVAVQNRLCVAGLVIRAVVFDHLVWVEHIGPDLAAPFDFFELDIVGKVKELDADLFELARLLD